MSERRVDIPAKVGKVEIREASGRCVIDNCRVSGGGLVSIQHVTEDALQLPELAWGGGKVVCCGDHLLEVLTRVLRLPE